MYSPRVLKKAKWLLQNNKVHFDVKAQAYYFTVSGDKDENYDVAILGDRKSCTCLYWTYKQVDCSHIVACLLYLETKINKFEYSEFQDI